MRRKYKKKYSQEELKFYFEEVEENGFSKEE